MGAFLSLARRVPDEGPSDMPQPESSKRQRLSAGYLSSEQAQLIPGLPDELSLHILARVPRGCHSVLRSVCRGWHEVLATSEIFQLRKELGLTEEWLYILMKDEEERLVWHVLDPVEGKWCRLPPMPEISHEHDMHQVSGWGWLNSIGSSGLRISGLFRGWFGRRDSLDRTPFCGCSAGAANGCLYVLGGFSRACAMRCVWRYDPLVNQWSEAAPMLTPRAYCKTGLLGNKLYAVGGVNRGGRGGLTPLQSAEVFEPETNTWTPIPNMPFARAQVLPTAFLADMLKPIATGMAAFKGKLCVPQSLYSWPFFVDVGGEVYDPVSELWLEMPQGMGEGWPARQAGTKLSVVVNGQLYALNPTSSMDGSKIKMYDSEQDVWKVVLKKVPILLELTDAESPYLLAGFREKLHVITKDIHDNIAVLRAELGNPPPGGNSESDVEGWKSIASKNFGSVELVTCQVLDL